MKNSLGYLKRTASPLKPPQLKIGRGNDTFLLIQFKKKKGILGFVQISVTLLYIAFGSQY